MFHVRVTRPDGASTTHPMGGTQCSIGRDASNDIVLEGNAVSSLHCMFELTPNGCVVKERGSTNGTWLNGRRLQQPSPVTEADRIYVGSFLVELTRVAPEATGSSRVPSPAALDGPILRTSSASDRAWRELLGRFGRYADEWDAKGRPSTLGLRSEELRRAKKWLRHATGEREHEVSRLVREFIATSEKVARAGAIKRALAAIALVLAAGAGVAALIILWPEATEEEPEADTDVAVATEGFGDDASDGEFSAFDPDVDDVELEEEGDVNAAVDHEVIPFETIGDIARRYGVTVDDIAEWNFLNADEPNLDQRKEPIKILAPTKRPLAQQKVEYEIEPGEESWTKLGDRFDVPATRLEAYNDSIELKAGATITVWVDPKPYQPRDADAKVPAFDFKVDSVSVGKPGAGHLRGGRQLPARPALYTRRAPQIMYGSSYMLKHVSEAVAAFRNDVAYDGALILADISKRSGGHFPPHKSHQAGRDIDIWLPTLKGVYKTKFIKGGRERVRRPLFAEVDWYALWGLVRALIKTGAVEMVFLDWRYQQFVYRAAANMGATQQQLDDWIQWPQKNDPRAIFRHSKDHLSHIHVRFKCAPYERECQGKRGK